MITKKEMLAGRDEKAKTHLIQYAPVWIVEETFNLPDQQMIFHAVFQHNRYGWVKRRYLYDGATDVLYHKGQVMVSDEELIALQETEPKFSAVVNDIPNAYGG